MYISKATFKKEGRKKIEYIIYSEKLGADIQSPLSQKELKALFELLPKDEKATRLTGGGVYLEYTKTI